MTNEYYMHQALEEARKAYKKKEVPVGCVIVYQGRVIARAHNLRERKNNIFTHAEILAIKKASRKLKCWHLEGCEMYVTLEPCPMCSGSILQSRLTKVVYGAPDIKGGCVKSRLNMLDMNFSNPRIEQISGVCEDECVSLIKSFFKDLRKK